MRRSTTGGSVASNAVVQKVPVQSFDMLTKNFSNYTNSASCPGQSGGKHRRGCSCKKHKPSCKRGGTGNVISNVSNSVSSAARSALSSAFPKGGTTEGFNVFRSSPAPAGYEYANLRGNTVRSGGMGLKNMSEYMNNASTYTVRNRSGGSGASGNAGSAPGLNYSGITSGTKVMGDMSGRATPIAVDRLLADSNHSSLPALNKTTGYGSTTDSAHFFNYSGVKDPFFGGKKRRAAKPAKKTKPVKKPVKKTKPVKKAKPAKH